jgi:hypothetical protein
MGVSASFIGSLGKFLSVLNLAFVFCKIIVIASLLSLWGLNQITVSCTECTVSHVLRAQQMLPTVQEGLLSVKLTVSSKITYPLNLTFSFEFSERIRCFLWFSLYFTVLLIWGRCSPILGIFVLYFTASLWASDKETKAPGYNIVPVRSALWCLWVTTEMFSACGCDGRDQWHPPFVDEHTNLMPYHFLKYSETMVKLLFK